MPDQYKEDKTEKATSRRRQQARSKGNIAYSKEVSLVIMLMGAILGFYVFGGYMRDSMLLQFHYFFTIMNRSLGADEITGFCMNVLVTVLKIVLPMWCVFLFLSYLSTYVQAGNVFTPQALKFKLSSLKPKFSTLNIFKKDQLMKLGTSLGKLLIVGPVAYFTVTNEIERFIMLLHDNVFVLFNFICMMAFKVVFRVSLVLIFLAALDFAYQKWKYEEDLKMTKQEVKDEAKNMDQDPKIKSKIRQFGKEIMRKLMYGEVPKADVVITNPTHIAIAIKYDPETMSAPKVLAKGMRLMAEKIKSIAREHNVPVVENKPLAQLLFKTVDVGQEIPPDLYRAVAEILAYVYKMNKKRIPGLSPSY